jgi:polar amino acid transport system substrate-binding protein
MHQVSKARFLPFLRWAAVVAVAVLALPSIASSQDAPKELVNAGKLTYGTAAGFPPFEYLKDGTVVGFDIDLAAALAAKLGLQPEMLNMAFDGLIPALKGKRIDILNSAMYIKPEREQQVDFIPYMKLGEQMLVHAGNPQKINTLDDLPGKTMPVTVGTIEEIWAKELNAEFEKQGKPPIKLLTFPSQPDTETAFRQKRADVMFTSTPGAAFLVASVPGVYEVVGQVFKADTRIGIAVRKGETGTKQAVEEALKAIVKDGTFAALLKKYALPEGVNILQ